MLNNLNLKNNELSPFNNFSDELMQSLEGRIKIFLFKKKQFVYREGFFPTGLFVITKGKVKVFKTAYNGKEVIISIARENDTLGYHFLINKTEYRSSACATEDTEVKFFPKMLFYELIDQYPDFSLKLMQIFANEYDKALDKLVDVASKQVRKRVAELLLRLMKKHGTEKDNLTLNIILPREDLAHLVATNTETLVRILTEFRKEEFIALKGKKISIINQKMLSKVSELY